VGPLADRPDITWTLADRSNITWTLADHPDITWTVAECPQVHAPLQVRHVYRGEESYGGRSSWVRD
jgi:hypothetical protein